MVMEGFKLPLFVLAIPVVVIIRVIRPFILIRFGELMSYRIGHFAANTELYFCERDAGINVPKQRYIDLFSLIKPISNKQLERMWRRILLIWPRGILLQVLRVNRLIPGGYEHEVGNNTQHDRDVYNLFDRFPSHLQFTLEEESLGNTGLRSLGVPEGVPFVCLNVRDSAYFGFDLGYHSYRDSDIQNYILVAEGLANRGYYVIRMGAKVQEAMKSNHPWVIDYAANGKRSDFMDIYLGAKCHFAISTGTGWDAVPTIFHRPVCYVNFAPIGYIPTWHNQLLSICKHHFSSSKGREMSLSEIFTEGVGFCLQTSTYESKGVQLIDNTPEEIRDVAFEMADRLSCSWQSDEDDDMHQQRFWEVFPIDAVGTNGNPLHGAVRARFGSSFLRNNQWWLQ